MLASPPRTVLARFGLLMLVALPLACESSSPTSPSAPHGVAGATVAGGAVTASAADDGSTLKVSAPIPQSPVLNVEVEILTPSLSVANASAAFVSGLAFPHEFELYQVEANGALTMVDTGVVPQGPAGSTSYPVSTPLNDETPHQWRARGRYQGAKGPWSSMAAFRTNAPVWIAAPVPLDPNDGELVTGLRPVLQIANPEIEGDSGPVTVEFRLPLIPSLRTRSPFLVREWGITPRSPRPYQMSTLRTCESSEPVWCRALTWSWKQFTSGVPEQRMDRLKRFL